MRLSTVRLSLLLASIGVTASAGCSRPPGHFLEPNARAHIGMLAGTIGSRPIGTPANARARAYIIDQLRLFGFDVRVQEADARRASIGITARVSNIIAVRPGRRPEAVALVSHYDSVPAGPGAADDALGVGVSLEAARVLAARTDRNWTLMILVTDGEEAGLMGAAALMSDREVTSRLQAYINLEAIGSAGPPMLFETGPGNGWLVGPWARHAPNPRGASFGIEIYRRLPNDTDFSILKRQGIPGLNFAAIGDSYAYHTTRDTPERLSPLTVRRTGEQVVAIMTALDAEDITQRSGADRTFFDIAGTSAISYGPVVGWVLALAAPLVGIIAWVRVVGAAIKLEGLLRWLLTSLWTLAGSAAVVASMVGATWALRAAREVYHPWYARPGRLFLFLLAVGFTIGWSIARLGQWLPRRAHGLRHPLVAWSLALPVWVVLAAGMLSLAPGAAYLWLLPLLGAGLLFSILPLSNAVAVRAASVVIFLITATLWLPEHGRSAPIRRGDLRAAADRHAGLRVCGRHGGGRPHAHAAARGGARQDRAAPLPEARDGGLPVRRGRDGQVRPHGAGLHERRTASAGRTGGAGRRWSSRLGRGIGRTGRRSGGRRTVGLDAGSGGADGRSAVAPTAAPVRLPSRRGPASVLRQSPSPR